MTINVYCKTCNKKVLAKVLKKFHRQYRIEELGEFGDVPTKVYFCYGLVQVLSHKQSLFKKCTNTSQFKTIVESDSHDGNGVLV